MVFQAKCSCIHAWKWFEHKVDIKCTALFSGFCFISLVWQIFSFLFLFKTSELSSDFWQRCIIEGKLTCEMCIFRLLRPNHSSDKSDFVNVIYCGKTCLYFSSLVMLFFVFRQFFLFELRYCKTIKTSLLAQAMTWVWGGMSVSYTWVHACDSIGWKGFSAWFENIYIWIMIFVFLTM